MPAGNPSGAADLIEAISSILWPLLLLVLILVFKDEIRGLFGRLLKLKGPGFELELDKDLDKAKQRASAAKESVRPDIEPPPEPEPPGGRSSLPRPPGPILPGMADPPEEEMTADTEHAKLRTSWQLRDPTIYDWGTGFVARITDEAARSPKAALISLAGGIEHVSREVLVSQGHPVEARAARSLLQHLTLIDLSPRVKEAAEEFQEIRNRIVHGSGATDEDALRAIDIGLDIWDALREIPREVNYVVAPAVDTFADADGDRPHDFKAVVLAAYHPPDAETQMRAFPIGREMPSPGTPVTWEWNMERIYPEAWYRDPVSEELKYGWAVQLNLLVDQFTNGPHRRFAPILSRLRSLPCCCGR